MARKSAVTMPGLSKPKVMKRTGRRKQGKRTAGSVPPKDWDLAPVLVDDRAGSVDLVKYHPLKRSGQLTRLRSGDVMIVGKGPGGKPILVGIEVKSVSDLIGSIDNGRLQGKQLPEMLQDYDDTWLLTYGDYRCSDHGDLQTKVRGKWVEYVYGGKAGAALPYVYLEAFLHTATAVGVRHRHVYGTPRDVSLWVGGLARWWNKPWAKHGGMKTLDQPGRPGLMPDVDRDTHLRARVAACLPGLGYKRAVDVATQFGSVRQMVLADREQWLEVPGVGDGVWRAVDEALGDW